jgi:hypothetical protein
MVPSIIVAVETFSMLPNGKLDYNRLPEVDLSTAAVNGATSGGEVVLPRTKLEAVVAEAWATVLKVHLIVEGCGFCKTVTTNEKGVEAVLENSSAASTKP